MTKLNIQGKRVLVTGAASGIGQAVVQELYKSGAEVFALDVQTITADAAKKIELDLSREESILRARDEVGSDIDAICNIAGVPMSAARETVLAVNWVGTRIWTEALLEAIKPGGVVVNTASVGGRMWRSNLDQIRDCLMLNDLDGIGEFCAQQAIEPQLSYKLTKETLVAWTLIAAKEWVSLKVRCNVVSPGIIETPMLAAALAASGERGQRFAQTAPRFCELKEAANVYAFLCSDEASALNGVDVPIDAGLAAILNVEDFELS